MIVVWAILAIPLCLAASSVLLARSPVVTRNRLLTGGGLAMAGLGVLVLAALSTREDTHYDDFGSAMTALAAMIGGGLLILGLGPFVPWLLSRLGWLRGAVRAAPAVAATLCATAIAVTTMIVTAGQTAQDVVGYVPEGPPSVLIVRGFATERTADVRAALQLELPGVPLVATYQADDIFSVDPAPDEDGQIFIGDRDLLRYLTGDPETPYDEKSAVLVTEDGGPISSAEISYRSPDDRKTVPATRARPAAGRQEGAFLPEAVVRELGVRLEAKELIIDPATHLTTAAERERIAARLGATADVYLERGFQAPTGWPWLLMVAAVVALAAAVVIPFLVRWELAGRLRRARRTACVVLIATGGGAGVGSVIGLLLVWPWTASSEWDPVPRAGFDPPWTYIVALAAVIPAVAALVAALVPHDRVDVSSPA